MFAILLEYDRHQKVRAGPGRVERRRRLADLLAGPAGQLLAHGLDDLPLARNDLQRLGDVLADLPCPHASYEAARLRPGLLNDVQDAVTFDHVVAHPIHFPAAVDASSISPLRTEDSWPPLFQQ